MSLQDTRRRAQRLPRAGPRALRRARRTNSRRAPPAAMPLPMSTSARDRMPASTWRGSAPSAARSPISRVRRETLIGHQREDAQRREKQDERSDRDLRSDHHDQAHIPLPDPFVQRLRVLDEQSRIDCGRDDRQTRGERGRIAAHAHAHHERRHRSRRRGVKHIRLLVALVVRVQTEVAHDAHDLEPRLRAADAVGGGGQHPQSG